MRRHQPYSAKPQAGTASPESLARLRARIEQRRAQLARRLANGEPLVALPEAPTMRRRRWEARAEAVRKGLATGSVRPKDVIKRLPDPEVAALGQEFLKAAERGNAALVAAFLQEGFPASYQDPQTGESALHIAAAGQGRKVLRVLLTVKALDYLLRDRQGRLASELAYTVGEDPAVARLLGIKERKQAEADGVKLRRRPFAGIENSRGQDAPDPEETRPLPKAYD